MTSIMPNSFNVPNLYIDTLMPLLAPSEFAVLMYATRAILGWQFNASSRQANISLKAFEHGDTLSRGCGLSRPTIVNALNELVRFGVLRRVDGNRQLGQRWELTVDDEEIKIESLRQRFAETQSTKPLPAPAKPKKAPKQTVVKSTTVERVADPVFDAIASNWYDAETPVAVKAVSGQVVALRKRIEAHQPGITAEMIERFIRWYRKGNPGMHLPTGDATVAKWINRWAKEDAKRVRQAALTDNSPFDDDSVPMFGAQFMDMK